MSITTRIILLCTLLLATLETKAQELIKSDNNPWATSAAYQNAIESLDHGNMDEAFVWFDKEVKLHPSNGYALVNWGLIKALKSLIDLGDIDPDNGTNVNPTYLSQFLTSMDNALEMMQHGIDLIPSSDSQAVCDACMLFSSTIEYKLRATHMSTDSVKQLNYLSRAVEVHPCEKVLLELMDKKMVDGDITSIKDEIELFYETFPTNHLAVALMAKLTEVQKNYEKTIELADTYFAMPRDEGSQSLDANIMTLKAQALNKLGKEREAIDLLLQIIEDPTIDAGNNAINELLRIAATSPNEVLMKLRQHEFTSQGDPTWPLMQGIVYSYSLKNHKAAIPYYETVLAAKPGDKMTVDNLAYCYYMAGMVDKALLYADASDRMNGSNDKTAMLLKLGRLDEIIASRKTIVSLSNVTNIDIDNYSFLGKLYYLNKDHAQALPMLNKAIALNDSMPEANYLKGMILKQQGNENDANTCFEKAAAAVPQHSASPETLMSAMSLVELGRLAEAREANDMLAAEWEKALQDFEPTSLSVKCSSTAYEIAAIYNMLGDTAQALKFLDLHFQHDYLSYNFGLINLDRRFDSLRQQPEFVDMINKYYSMWKGNEAYK